MSEEYLKNQKRIAKIEMVIHSFKDEVIELDKKDDKRISELEASSASHTETIKDFERYLNISTPKPDIQEEIAELGTRIGHSFDAIAELKEHHAHMINVNRTGVEKLFTNYGELRKRCDDLNDINGEAIDSNADKIKELKERVEGLYKSIHGIAPDQADVITEVLRELKKNYKYHLDTHCDLLPFEDMNKPEIKREWKERLYIQLAKLDVGSARQTVLRNCYNCKLLYELGSPCDKCEGYDKWELEEDETEKKECPICKKGLNHSTAESIIKYHGVMGVKADCIIEASGGEKDIKQELISEFVEDLEKILDYDDYGNGVDIVDIMEKWEKKLR